MSRNIHDADYLAARQCKPGEAEVDRHLALFFFFEPVGVNPGKCFDKRGLTVVHMARRAYDAHEWIPALPFSLFVPDLLTDDRADLVVPATNLVQLEDRGALVDNPQFAQLGA